MRVEEDVDAGYMFGRIQQHDGPSPQWISDSEERFLERLRVEPENSLLWNKLGNLYERGGRTDLAAAVFEYSLGDDAAQVKSHYSLANLLYEIEAWELAVKHFDKRWYMPEYTPRLKRSICALFWQTACASCLIFIMKRNRKCLFCRLRRKCTWANEWTSFLRMNAN